MVWGRLREEKFDVVIMFEHRILIGPSLCLLGICKELKEVLVGEYFGRIDGGIGAGMMLSHNQRIDVTHQLKVGGKENIKPSPRDQIS